MNRRSLLRVGLTLLALLLLVLAGRTLWQQWHSLQAQPVTWGFVPAALALAAFAGALTYGVLIDSWRRILGGDGGNGEGGGGPRHRGGHLRCDHAGARPGERDGRRRLRAGGAGGVACVG